jgi:hypothetical protein
VNKHPPFTTMMMMKQATILISTFLTFNAVYGYTAEAFTSSRPRIGQLNVRAESCLHLLPTQGNQLVEASQTVYPPRRTFDDEDDEEEQVTVPKTKVATPSTTTTVPATTPSTARAFVSRVFSLPSSLIKKHPRAELEGLRRDSTTSAEAAASLSSLPLHGQDDVVLYPVTGFQYIADAPNHCRAVPKVSSAACRLPNNRDEVLYGYFLPAPKND